ncbi:MAG: hydrogenase 4 subunit F [Gammaproteobacteria bacterium]|nr:MAG: hydrogenase 4 subunit F [Gammaproteobacteria bacterium]
MNALLLTLLPSAGGMLLLAAIARYRWAAPLNLGLSILGFTGSLWLAHEVLTRGLVQAPGLRVDVLNAPLLVLTAFVGMTTAFFSLRYMAQVVRAHRIGRSSRRLYHSLYQAFLFTMLLALATDNLGILWVAVEGATLATVLLVSLYRTPESVEAAWKYFILCGVGIAQALFGTVLIYFAAQQAIPDPAQGLTWSVLHQYAPRLHPTVMSIAFVFALVGYGTKVGLVPLHHWLPDAHSEGPAPISALLSGLLLNVALYAVLRLKVLADAPLLAAGHPRLTGYLLMGFGLVSFLVAALFLQRQQDIKRLFAYSSIEHMGLATFAFGLGGGLATFAGLFHMLVHSLTKSSLFITVGHATQVAGSQRLQHIRGLLQTQPALGWGLLLGAVAIAGFPPFGLFTSEFLLISATLDRWPFLSLLLLSGLAMAFAGIFRQLHPVVFGEPPAAQRPVRASLLPVAMHLSLVLWLGLSVPPVLAGWLDQATHLLAGVDAFGGLQ